MGISLTQLTEAERLAASGQYQALLEYLAPSASVLEASPTLSLLFASANARLGKDDDAAHWAETALIRAREHADRAIEARALNLRGAIALEGGDLDEAANFFMRALLEARLLDDHTTLGRCSNNLGIVADQRASYEQAMSWYRLALAAYQQAGYERGLVETQHNLAMTHLARRDYRGALDEEDRAVEAADQLEDLALYALTLSGRAEIRVLGGDPAFGRGEAGRALQLHRQLGDVVGEAQDLRILALADADLGDEEIAEETLRDVIERAGHLGRPHLAAMAGRDLANLLERQGRFREAHGAARSARARFQQLGAALEVQKVDEMLHRLQEAGADVH